MKLSEYRGDEAILIMADLLVPVSIVLGNKETKEFFQKNPPTLDCAQYLLKKFPHEVLQMIAIVNKVDISVESNLENFKQSIGVVRLFQEVVSLLNDPDIQSLFISQRLSKEETSSISAMENTEA